MAADRPAKVSAWMGGGLIVIAALAMWQPKAGHGPGPSVPHIAGEAAFSPAVGWVNGAPVSAQEIAFVERTLYPDYPAFAVGSPMLGDMAFQLIARQYVEEDAARALGLEPSAAAARRYARRANVSKGPRELDALRLSLALNSLQQKVSAGGGAAGWDAYVASLLARASIVTYAPLVYPPPSARRPGASPAQVLGFPLRMPRWLPGPAARPAVKLTPATPVQGPAQADVTIRSLGTPKWAIDITETAALWVGHATGSGPGYLGAGSVSVCGRRVQYLAFGPPLDTATVFIPGRHERYSVAGAHLTLGEVVRAALSLLPTPAGTVCQVPPRLPLSSAPSKPAAASPGSGTIPAAARFRWAVGGPAPLPPGARPSTPPPVGSPGEYLVTDYLVMPGLTLWAGEVAGTDEGFVAAQRAPNTQPTVETIVVGRGYAVLTRLAPSSGMPKEVYWVTESGTRGAFNPVTMAGRILNGG